MAEVPRAGRLLLAACAPALTALAVACGPAHALSYEGFSAPHGVTISGWSGSAMEPAISPDGRYLLFNSSNVAPAIPQLQVAERTGPGSFEYLGPIAGEGVNLAGQLSGTPSLDSAGELFFVSTRAYSETLATVYEASFAEGAAAGVQLLPGVAGEFPGMVDFDCAVSPDGRSLYVSAGDFRSGQPTTAHLVLFRRTAGGFERDPASGSVLANVNRAGALNYAAAVSSDGLELFFTRASPASGVHGLPRVYRAARTKPGQPFGKIQPVGAITGFAEAPSLSSDGRTIYFHELVGGTFRIMSAARAGA